MRINLFNELDIVCLYTYETASARKRFVQFACDYAIIDELVTRHFGHHRMDNKITLVFRDTTKPLSDPIYATYWDGELSIGLDVFFLANMTLTCNQYRRIDPKQ